MSKRPTTATGQNQATDTDICCPVCQQQETYRLADGRYKCKQCKKKFSLKQTRARVSSDTLNAIAAQFWEMKTAEQCAHELDINRKTAQNYYSKLRDNIAGENARALDRMNLKSTSKGPHTALGKHPVFWFLIEHNQIRIIFPEIQGFSLQEKDLPAAQGVSEIYTNSPAARKNIVLDKFYRRTLWVRKETDDKLLQDFWRQTKLNLMKYRGGCKSNFPHFITEMAFRFNHRESEGTIHLLCNKISGSASET